MDVVNSLQAFASPKHHLRNMIGNVERGKILADNAAQIVVDPGRNRDFVVIERALARFNLDVLKQLLFVGRTRRCRDLRPPAP
jgi:hypothetical protein